MSCCRFNLPEPFSWKINGIGQCGELVSHLQRIMKLPQTTEEAAEITVMPRSCYDAMPEKERAGLHVFYSRKAVRLFHYDSPDRWLLVLPEEILSDRKVRIVLMWLILQPFFLHCLAHGALPVHAASADWNGQGIIVAASGDTGKTTTVRRLPPPWRELGDDAALLLPCRKGFQLYPLPTWSEFIYGEDPSLSWDFESGTRLSGIFFLHQAEKDCVEALSVPVATMRLHRSAMEAMGALKKQIPGNLKTKIFETAANIAGITPAFALYATQNGTVRESVEAALSKGNKVPAL